MPESFDFADEVEDKVFPSASFGAADEVEDKVFPSASFGTDVATAEVSLVTSFLVSGSSSGVKSPVGENMACMGTSSEVWLRRIPAVLKASGRPAASAKVCKKAVLIRPLESEPGRGGGEGRALTGTEPFLPRFSADSGVRKAGETRGEEIAFFLSMVCFKLEALAPLPFPEKDLLEIFLGGMMKMSGTQTEEEG